MRKKWIVLIILCLIAKEGYCRGGKDFKEYLRDRVKKYSDLRFVKTKIEDNRTTLTYSIMPRNDIVKKDGLIARILDARPLDAYKKDDVITADKSAQNEFSYYFHSVKGDYLYVLFLRKKTIPTFLKGEEAIEDTTHKILVIPLKGFKKDRGSITLSYYETRKKDHVVINDDYHILLQLKGPDSLKVQFREAGYNF